MLGSRFSCNSPFSPLTSVFSVITENGHRARGEISLHPASCVLFISYVENQGGLENVTEMDLVNYRELKNL